MILLLSILFVVFSFSGMEAAVAEEPNPTTELHREGDTRVSARDVALYLSADLTLEKTTAVYRRLIRETHLTSESCGEWMNICEAVLRTFAEDVPEEMWKPVFLEIFPELCSGNILMGRSQVLTEWTSLLERLRGNAEEYRSLLEHWEGLLAWDAASSQKMLDMQREHLTYYLVTYFDPQDRVEIVTQRVKMQENCLHSPECCCVDDPMDQGFLNCIEGDRLDLHFRWHAKMMRNLIKVSSKAYVEKLFIFDSGDKVLSSVLQPLKAYILGLTQEPPHIDDWIIKFHKETFHTAGCAVRRRFKPLIDSYCAHPNAVRMHKQLKEAKMVLAKYAIDPSFREKRRHEIDCVIREEEKRACKAAKRKRQKEKKRAGVPQPEEGIRTCQQHTEVVESVVTSGETPESLAATEVSEGADAEEAVLASEASSQIGIAHNTDSPESLELVSSDEDTVSGVDGHVGADMDTLQRMLEQLRMRWIGDRAKKKQSRLEAAAAAPPQEEAAPAPQEPEVVSVMGGASGGEMQKDIPRDWDAFCVFMGDNGFSMAPTKGGCKFVKYDQDGKDCGSFVAHKPHGPHERMDSKSIHLARKLLRKVCAA